MRGEAAEDEARRPRRSCSVQLRQSGRSRRSTPAAACGPGARRRRDPCRRRSGRAPRRRRGSRGPSSIVVGRGEPRRSSRTLAADATGAAADRRPERSVRLARAVVAGRHRPPDPLRRSSAGAGRGSPVAAAIALADGAGRRDDRRLADALRAARPAVRRRVLDEDGLDLGRVGASSAACSRAATRCADDRRRRSTVPSSVALPRAITTPPVIWPERTGLVQDAPDIGRGDDLEDPDDAGRRVDADRGRHGRSTSARRTTRTRAGRRTPTRRAPAPPAASPSRGRAAARPHGPSPRAPRS